MSKRVLLINPSLPQKTTQLNIPPGLLYLGTWLHHQNYDINILDAFNGNIEKRTAEELQDNPLAIGLSVMTAQISSAIEITRFIRHLTPNIPIIWGGIHPSLYPRQVLESGLVNFVVKDEGEIITTELLKALEYQRDFYTIKGLTFIDYDGKIVTNPDREPMDPDTLFCPDPNLVEDIRGMSKPTIMKQIGRGVPLITSRGCPHRCTFCINSIRKEPYRFRKAPLVVQDLQELTGQGFTEIGFMDEDFFTHKPRLVEILDGIEQSGLKFRWYAAARADHFKKNRTDQNLLKRLKESGCRQLGLGLESGSQRILNLIKKDITIRDSLNIAQLLDEVNIDATFSFIAGIPGETPKEIKQTIALLLRIAGINNNFRIFGPFIFRPYAGSELYNKCLELGMKEPKTLEDWINNPYIGSTIDPKDYNLFPWIAYPMRNLVKLTFYCWMSGLKLKGPGLTRLARKIGAWRCRHTFLAFPIEMWTLNLLRRLNLEKRLTRGKFH